MTSTESLLLQAVKSITVAEIDDARLVPEQADRFLRVVERESVLLGETRRLDMRADRRNIDRTGFSDRVLTEPQNEAAEYTPRVEPDFLTNELVAAKARGAVNISDEALEENIEREGFESTLVDMIASRAALDLEELLLSGGTNVADDFLELVDGWLVSAGESVAGDATPGPGEFDEADVEDMFDKMLLAVDDKYLRNLPRWRFYVTWAQANAYRDVLRDRETPLGDSAQTQANPLAFKGIPVRVVPLMPAGRALLTNVDNTVYGIRRDIQIEPERKASFDRWDFHVRVKADANYEDENAAVAASGSTIV